MSWTPDFALALAEGGRRPLFERVAAALVDAIRAGRLRPGARLPSTRGLARSLGVHRNTVIAAYRRAGRAGLDPRAPAGAARSCPRRCPRSGRSAFARRARRAPDERRLPAAAGDRPARRRSPGRRRRACCRWPAACPTCARSPTAELARAYRRALRPPRSVAARLRLRARPSRRCASSSPRCSPRCAASP